VLDFDAEASAAAAEIAARHRASGRPVDVRDVLIAGIARSRRAALATRNARHVEGTGVEVVDPWASRGTVSAGRLRGGRGRPG
jgi:predicted nucleic acid-binding protein